jgi:hypothetical protein
MFFLGDYWALTLHLTIPPTTNPPTQFSQTQSIQPPWFHGAHYQNRTDDLVITKGRRAKAYVLGGTSDMTRLSGLTPQCWLAAEASMPEGRQKGSTFWCGAWQLKTPECEDDDKTPSFLRISRLRQGGGTPLVHRLPYRRAYSPAFGEINGFPASLGWRRRTRGGVSP